MKLSISIALLLMALFLFISNTEGVTSCSELTDITKINENYTYIEGDILIGTEMANALGEATDPFQPQNAVVTNAQNIWIDGVVPYIIDPEMNNQARVAIMAAILAYETSTCVRLIPRTNQIDYVRFFADRGCYSFIGRIGGSQVISIGRGCEFVGIVIHEIFHALGRWHEQSRSDRDDFIRVNFQNIQVGRENNFERLEGNFVTTQDLIYDYLSIMHYRATAFTSNGQPTISTIDIAFQSEIGQRGGLSETDIEHVNRLYSCNSVSTWGQWSQWSGNCQTNCRDYFETRTRSCQGNDCLGDTQERRPCSEAICPTVAMWGTWEQWRECTMTCGGGNRFRTRICENGQNCAGSNTQSETCNTAQCPIALWNIWGAWSMCSQTCGGGQRTRTRTCNIPNGCVGLSTDFGQCNTNECPSDSGLLINLRELGCYEYTLMVDLFFYINGTRTDLDRNNRVEAITQIIACARSAVSRNRNILFFGMIDGYCIQQGDQEQFGPLRRFVGEPSTACVNQVGNLDQSLSMTVWFIYTPSAFEGPAKRRRQTFNNLDNSTIDTMDLGNCGISTGENLTDGAMSDLPQPMTMLVAAIMSMLSLAIFMYN